MKKVLIVLSMMMLVGCSSNETADKTKKIENGQVAVEQEVKQEDTDTEENKKTIEPIEETDEKSNKSDKTKETTNPAKQTTKTINTNDKKEVDKSKTKTTQTTNKQEDKPKTTNPPNKNEQNNKTITQPVKKEENKSKTTTKNITLAQHKDYKLLKKSTNAKYTTSNSNVKLFSEDGYKWANAIKEGKCTVTATLPNGDKYVWNITIPVKKYEMTKSEIISYGKKCIEAEGFKYVSDPKKDGMTGWSPVDVYKGESTSEIKIDLKGTINALLSGLNPEQGGVGIIIVERDEFWEVRIMY